MGRPAETFDGAEKDNLQMNAALVAALSAATCCPSLSMADCGVWKIVVLKSDRYSLLQAWLA